jgi:single-strand DNA-binding protein
MNKAVIYGRLGQDPETKDLGNDNTVANFSVATSRKYWSKKEDKQVEDVQWHSCSAFGKTGINIAKFLKKGDPILLEGRIEYRSYEKEGVKAKATNILVDRFEFVSGRVSDSEEARDAQTQTSPSQAQPELEPPRTNYAEPTPF